MSDTLRDDEGGWSLVIKPLIRVLSWVRCFLQVKLSSSFRANR